MISLTLYSREVDNNTQSQGKETNEYLQKNT